MTERAGKQSNAEGRGSSSGRSARPPGGAAGGESLVARVLDRLSFASPWASQALAWLTPAVVEQAAADRFAEPRRPAHAAEPYVHGLTAHRFRVALGSEERAVWDWGEGPTVLLVHGWNGAAAQLAGYVQPLVDAGYHVVAFDQPGHGHSSGTHVTG